jgi:hypothetical protein
MSLYTEIGWKGGIDDWILAGFNDWIGTDNRDNDVG